MTDEDTNTNDETDEEQTTETETETEAETQEDRPGTEADDEFEDAMDGDLFGGMDEDEAEPSEEWTLGELKREVWEMDDTKILLEEPAEEEAFNKLRTGDAGPNAMYETAKIVVKKPVLTPRAWAAMTPRQKMLLGTKCAKFAGVIDIVQTLQGDFIEQAAKRARDQARSQSDGEGGEA